MLNILIIIKNKSYAVTPAKFLAANCSKFSNQPIKPDNLILFICVSLQICKF